MTTTSSQPPQQLPRTDRCPRTVGSAHVAGDDPLRLDRGGDGAVLHPLPDRKPTVSSRDGGPAAKPPCSAFTVRSPPTHSRRCWRAVTQLRGSPLGNPLLDRVTKSGKVVRAVAGFDATFSAPKSLSVWWALTGDDGLAQCHDTAVQGGHRLSRTLRIHHPDPVERAPTPPRHPRTDRGGVPPDDVTVG